MESLNRRNFLKNSGLSVLPAFIPGAPAFAEILKVANSPAGEPVVKFGGDGEMFDAMAYLDQLMQMHAITPIERDFYGNGGAIAALEKKFEEITGKEKAIFMPTGTMANQLALAVLSGENTKVFVQETSHVFRDEADAAQSVFGKRLIPLARGKTFFTAEELEQAVDYHNQGEVFKSGIGTVSIENPVRRTDGKMVPIEEIKKISGYCRKNYIRLHLDGARIFMASGRSGIKIREYSSYFDTVYISLYKYLGAAAGAILCGEKAVIDKMVHLIKIHGGTMFGNWANAAMALHRLTGFEDRFRESIKRAGEIFNSLNQLKEMKISLKDGGTNIYDLKLTPEVNGREMVNILAKDHGIMMYNPDKNNEIKLTVNETLLYRDTKSIVNSIRQALKSSVKKP